MRRAVVFVVSAIADPPEDFKFLFQYKVQALNFFFFPVLSVMLFALALILQ